MGKHRKFFLYFEGVVESPGLVQLEQLEKAPEIIYSESDHSET
jgi:hypothetical protein